MELAFWSIPLDLFMRDIGKMIYLMVKADIYQTLIFILKVKEVISLVSLIAQKLQVTVSPLEQMDPSLKASSKMGRSMDMEK